LKLKTHGNNTLTNHFLPHSKHLQCTTQRPTVQYCVGNTKTTVQDLDNGLKHFWTDIV